MSGQRSVWLSFFPLGARLAAFPSWSQPRLVIRAGGPMATPHLVRFFPAWRRRACLYRAWLQVQVRLRRVRGERLGEGGSLSEVVGQLCGGQVVAVLPDRHGRCRAVAVVCDTQGKVVAYLKYAWEVEDARRLAHEAAVLRSLPDGLGPRLMASELVGEGLLLALAPVEGAPLPARLPPPEGLAEFVQALVHGWSSAPDHPFLRALEDGPDAEAVRRWAEALRGLDLPMGLSHGDLAPWNLLRTRDGLVAVDWEEAELNGLPWLDLAYYVLRTALLIYRWPPKRTAWKAEQSLERILGLPSRQARALVAFSAYATWRGMGKGSPGAHSTVREWYRAVWIE